MSWTYEGNLTNRRDRIRFLVGDTDTNDQLLQDGEVDYYLTEYSNDHLCAATLCDAIAAKFSRLADTNNAGLSVSASQRAQAYRARAVELRKEATKSAPIWVGGRSISDKETAEEDTSRTQPAFKRGMFDHGGD